MSDGRVRLSGRLICLDDGQAALVHRHLPRHIMLTRAESGCLAFDVVSTDDPLVWRVDEEFSSDEAFDAHRRRVTFAGPIGLAAGSMAAATSAGNVRIEGKDSIMAHGDVMELRLNV